MSPSYSQTLLKIICRLFPMSFKSYTQGPSPLYFTLLNLHHTILLYLSALPSQLLPGCVGVEAAVDTAR